MKQSKYIMTVAMAMAIGLPVFAQDLLAQDQPKRGNRGNAPAPEKAEQQNSQPQNVQPPPTPQTNSSSSNNSSTSNSSTNNASPSNTRVPRNGFVANRPDMEQQRRGNRQLHPLGPRAGDWLRQFKDVPADQQERALTNDPAFQSLPADRQDKLRKRLQQFNSLSPDRKEQLLDRMETFETLPPEQRKRLREIQDRMKQLPEDRQQRVRSALHLVRGMSPDRRQSFFASPRFTGQFTPEEQDILRGLIDIAGSPELAEPQDPRIND